MSALQVLGFGTAPYCFPNNTLNLMFVGEVLALSTVWGCDGKCILCPTPQCDLFLVFEGPQNIEAPRAAQFLAYLFAFNERNLEESDSSQTHCPMKLIISTAFATSQKNDLEA